LAAFHILEMLHDTPNPDTPQSDHVGKTDRNAEIIARYKAGETGVSIAQAYGISGQRVSQILRGQRQ
jgi:Mor family transcriptional regulator